MKKLTTLLLGLVALFGLAGQASAVVCTIDQVPAATLLVPYFEVDFTNPNGYNTLFAITNVSEDSAVAHVTLWTPLSTPILDFNIYLTGYDVHTVSLYDVFNGILPRTGKDTGSGQTSPHSGAMGPYGPESGEPDAVDFNCAGALSPMYAALPPGQVALLQDYFTVCTDNATGYITIDNAEECNLLFPNDDEYYISDLLADENIFIGDVFYVDPGNNYASGTPAVHIEAHPDFALAGSPPTFYGRYADDVIDGGDLREPLPEGYAFRYISGGGFDGGTDMLVFRSHDIDPVDEDVDNCENPGFLPFLSTGNLYVFDEMENVIEVGGPSFPPTDFTCPWCIEAQRVDIAEIPTPDNFGWIWVDFDTTGSGDTDPFYDQAWVEVQYQALGRFEAGLSAAQVVQRCIPFDDTPTLDALDIAQYANYKPVPVPRDPITP